jgi:hypothetical protein
VRLPMRGTSPVIGSTSRDGEPQKAFV